MTEHFIALSGGVGGAKLALGLSKVLTPEQLTIVANTGDDFEHLGFPISPDLDTVMYTLAGINNQQQGWGLAGETWNFISALETLGGDTWFRLGDRDIATHSLRRQLLKEGFNLSQVTQHLCQSLGIKHRILPMSNDAIPTIVHSDQGDLAFQEYFVRDQCQPIARGFTFKGIENAQTQPEFLDLLHNKKLTAIFICPSNPFVSVDPILQLPGVLSAIRQNRVPVIAVSPIIGGQAIKGPAAKMMAELGMPQSATAVAQHYQQYGELLSGFVVDTADRGLLDDIQTIVPCLATPTFMQSLEDRIALAQAVLAFAQPRQVHHADTDSS